MKLQVFESKKKHMRDLTFEGGNLRQIIQTIADTVKLDSKKLRLVQERNEHGAFVYVLLRKDKYFAGLKEI